MRNAAVLLPLLLLAGCFTWKETEYPQVQMSAAPAGRDVRLQVNGFAANVTAYIPVYGQQTYYVGHGGFGPHGWHGGHYETAISQSYVPQTYASEAFIQRARDHFEKNGFLLRAPSPDYTVEVTFSGPFETEDERALEWVWMFASIFSAEYTTQTWTAHLKIYDAKSGRVAFSRDYSQKYEYCVWSPLFFIGLSGVTKNDFNHMQSWCLSALVDRSCADATAYLAGSVR